MIAVMDAEEALRGNGRDSIPIAQSSVRQVFLRSLPSSDRALGGHGMDSIDFILNDCERSFLDLPIDSPQVLTYDAEKKRI